MEEWRDIEGYEGLYQVSNYGNVKSLNYRRTGKEKMLSPNANNCGYLYVNLWKEGKMKYKQIHQLVAKAFIQNPLNLPQVNHKDENKTNNFVFVRQDGTVDQERSNLEWCTQGYNNNYGTRNKRAAEARINGKRSKQVFQYSLDGTLVAIWPSTAECGRNGFYITNVSACCNGKRKTHKGYRWSYNPQ